MQLPFFYHPSLEKNSTVMQPDEATSKHIGQVLRMKEGERIHFTNGKGVLALCELNAVSKKNCSARIIETNFSAHVVKRKVAIAVSPVKNTSRFEWFLEKATELGVAEIFPLICARTEREHFRYDRMNAICISAMLQSQQSWLPLLHEPVMFDAIIDSNTYQHKWIAHCIDSSKNDLASSLSPSMNDALMLIGPEGDFTAVEIEKAMGKKFAPASLGPTRLRTETAALTAATLLALV